MSDDSERRTDSKTQADGGASRRFDLRAASLVGVAAAGTLAVGVWIWSLHPPAASVLWACGLLAAAGASAFWYRVSQRERLLEQEARRVRAERERLEAERREWEDTQQQLLARLREEADQIARRWEELHDRMLTFHEWLEYPRPIDLRSQTDADAALRPAGSVPRTDAAEHGAQSPQAEPARGATETTETPTESGDTKLKELVEKDRQVLALLEEESERLYEAIRKNEFTVDGRFHWEKLRDELYHLIVRVARVYNPQSENPLLETSVEQLLRAGSRVCLHLLVLMESLPVAAHRYNIQEIHNYVRTATRVFGAYRTVAPWMNVARYALIPGRVVLGANPLTAVAWWAGSEAFRLGAKAFARRFVDRWAIDFLYSLVRVIAYEAAGIYGGDFRHRDANWIYGAELVNLVAAFPLSRESLRAALGEVSRLQLRNEYDRVYLYRCLSAHRCPPELLGSTEFVLTDEERQRVAEALENFYTQHIHGRTPSRLERWRADVERRLGVRLCVQPDARVAVPADPHGRLREALRSLACFLQMAKGLSPDEIRRCLAQSRMLQQMPADRREQTLDELADVVAQTPSVFEPPDLDPDDPLVAPYLDDLMALNLELPPASPVGDDLVREVAAHFRILGDAFDRRVQPFAEKWFAATRWPEAPRQTPPLPVLLALRSILEGNEVPRFAYPDVRVDGERTSGDAGEPAGARWLIGTDRRLLLFADRGEYVELEWECRRGEPLTVQRVSGHVWDDCLVTGGHPVGVSLPDGVAFRLSSGWLGSFETDFAALVRWAQAERRSGDAAEASDG